MQGKNALFGLIKTLSRGEKRAFKIFVSRYNKSNENLLLTLFEKINVQDEYKEELILKRLEKLKNKTPLAVLKNKLFKHILQSLRGHVDFEAHPISKINEQSEFAYILFQRGLFSEAGIFIEKARLMAEKMEYYNQLLPIMDLQYKISRHYLSVEKFRLLIEKLDLDRKRTTTILDNQWIYIKLQQELNQLYRTYDEPQNEEERKVYEQFFANEYLQDAQKALSNQALIYFYNLKTFYHNLLGKNDDAYQAATQHLDILKNLLSILKHEPTVYFVGLNNVMILAIRTERFEEYQTYLIELEAFAEQNQSLNPFHEKRIFEIKYASLIHYYKKSEQYAKGVELTQTLEDGIQKYRSVGLSNYRILRFYFSLALLNFYLSEWGEAHYYVDKVLEQEDGKTSITTVAYSKILDLLLHLDKKNFRFLEYQIVNVQRFLKKNHRYNKEEQILLGLLNKLIKERMPEQTKTLYENFLSEIAPLRERPLFRELKIYAWIESKIKGQTVLERLNDSSEN